MNRIQIDAPCKVNLSLDIVGKLPNGYHEMDMVRLMKKIVPEFKSKNSRFEEFDKETK